MNGKIKRYAIYMIAIHLVAALFCIPALADGEPAFRIDMDSLNMQMGISGDIIISMTNAQGAKIINIEGIENFEIVSQSQSSVTSINGAATEYREDSYYTVMPKAAGQFTLKANISYDGQTCETNALQVTVSENAGGGDDGETQDLFVKTLISHAEAYLGEKIVVTYELYSRYSIDSYRFTDDVAIDGVVAKDIPDNQLKAEYVYLNGERYAMYEAKRLIIDPIKPGGYVIPSCNFQVNVINSRSGGFGFFRSTTPVYLQTEEKELTVKPLPSNERPGDFSGIVGELQIESRYSRDELNYGDSLALYFTLSGNCNLDVIKGDIAGKMAGFSVYETQKNTAESVENNRYQVKKDFEAILVPEKNGIIEISPIFVSYFDPVTEKYEKAEIPGISVTVLGDMPQPNKTGASGDVLIINQVKYSDEKSDYFAFQLKKETAYKILAGSAAFFILFVVLIKLLAKQKRRDSELRSIYRKLAGSKDTDEIYDLFNHMIKHRYNLSLKASSKSAVLSGLPDADLALRVAEVMDYMESAKPNGKDGHDYLRDKIKGIYRMILKLRPSTDANGA